MTINRVIAVRRRVSWPIFVVLLFVGFLIKAQAASVVYDDFEDGTYHRWTMQGNCWDDKPATSRLFGSRLTGYQGNRYLSTLHPKLGVDATGSAVSQDFVIEKPYISMLVAGGHYPGAACFDLIVDGNSVGTVTGDDLPAFHRVIWNVMALIGRHAHFQVTDDMRAAVRGYIMIDDIEFADTCPQDVTAMTLSSDGVAPQIPIPPSNSPSSNVDTDAIQQASAAIASSSMILRAVGSLNAQRIRSNLPLISIRPELTVMANSLVDKQKSQTDSNFVMGPDLELLRTMGNRLLSRSDARAITLELTTASPSELARLIGSSLGSNSSIGLATFQTGQNAKTTMRHWTLVTLGLPSNLGTFVPVFVGVIGAAVSPAYLAGAGEIQLDGTVSASEPGKLTLVTESVTTADGRITKFSDQRQKIVRLPKSIAVDTLRLSGSHVIVVGKDTGPGAPLDASLLVVRH